MSHFKQQKGFSLVELMLVVVIIAVMAGAVSIGFSTFLGGVGVKNAAGHIQDVLHQLDLETAVSEYEKSTVSFEESFLLVDSKLAGTGITLSWQVPGATCAIDELSMKSSQDALLYTRDVAFKNLTSPLQVQAGTEVCVNPLKLMEREIVYQLESPSDASNKIRIFPLNYNEGETDEVRLEANDYSLEILAPYSQKKRYKGSVLLPEGQASELTVISEKTGESETFVLPQN